MRRPILSIVVLAAALGAGPALADPAASPAAAPAATTAQASDKDEIVCKSEPPPTGTRLGARRTCQTQAAWDKQREQSQADTSRNQMQGLTGVGTGRDGG